jgi:tetratricopeptide (TPR) repeat protein
MTLPPLAPGKIPAFHTLGDDVFEDLCRELIQEEENVQAAERYGTRGQRQEGVDILIDLRDQSKAAGQCKSHERCDEALIRDACTEFLKHAQRWRDEGVRAFILFLAADTRRTQLHQERARQRERLRQAGFAFSVWPGAILKSKLRRQRQIVRHFVPLLEDYICGPQTQLELRADTQEATIRVLAEHLGEAAEGDHDEIRKLWQDGHPGQAIERIEKLRQDVVAWEVLQASTKAKILRLHGRLLLVAGELPKAKALAAQAQQLDPMSGGRLAAMIAQAENRLDDAITALANDPDPDSQALKAAVQIQKGLIDAALTTIASLPGHPDAHRLHALVLLGRGEVQQAKAEAERALALAPTWYWMRRTAAAVRYLASLSPIAVPKGIPDWPEPVNSNLVREDDESVVARRSAATEFERLVQDSEHSTEDLACLQAWRIACLVDGAGSRADATEIARQALSSDPSNYRVLTWVLGRQLDVPIDATVEILEHKVKGGTADLEELISLIAVYTTEDRLHDARALLVESKERFQQESAEQLYRFWDSQLTRLEILADRRSGGDPDAQATAIRASLEDKGNDTHPEVRWQRFASLAQLGHWEYIAPVASELVDSLQTSDAVRMACHALYNTRDFRGCLAMLDRAPAFFPQGVVSPDLRRLRIFAQQAVGALPEAIRDARDAFEQSPTRQALMELARLLFRVGDLKTLAVHARKHIELPDLSVHDSLTLAFFLKLEDPVLASTLWRRAADAGIDDDHVGMAYEIGNALGLDTELKPLVHRIAALGKEGKGGVKAFDLHELIEWSTQRRQHLEEVWERFRRGELPSHTALGIVGINLVHAQHRIPTITAGRTDGLSAGPIYQRFGGRASRISSISADAKLRLNADITALLSATHFGVLGRLEAAFAPIRIPQNTIIALARIEGALRPSQPRRVEAQRQVIEAVLAKKVATFEPASITERDESEVDIAEDVLHLLREARSKNALVLDFLPLRSIDPARRVNDLRTDDADRLRDAHAVVDALLACGTLSAAEHREAIERVGTRHGLPTVAAMPAGAELVCRGDVLELIALAGVLDATVATFKTSVTAADLREAQAEVAFAAAATADADWVRALIGRIRDGVATGVYVVLPDFDRQPEREGGHEPTPEETVLLDLIQFPADEADVIWTDDRWMTSHQHRDAARVVGTVDLLALLTQREQLTEADFLQTLTDMRAADVRFVAFDADELLRILLEAPVAQGRLVETKALRVARQYYARCLLDANLLRPPFGGQASPNSTTEWNFLLMCGMAVSNAMVRVWDRGSVQDAAARSEWLLRNLFADDRGMYGTVMPRTESNDVFRVTVSLVGLIANALQVNNRRARRDYLTWVYRRVLRSRFATDDTLPAAVAEHLKQTITNGIASDDPAMRPVATLLMRRLWADLPKELRRLLESDQDLLRALGVSMTSIVEIGPLRIERKAAWDALARILRDGSEMQLRTIDGHAVDIARASNSSPTFSVRCDAVGFDGQIGGEEFWLLSDSIAEREAAVARVPDWFDLRKDQREELVARIVGGQDSTTRIELALTARQASGETLYRRLFDSIRPGETFRPDDAMPTDPVVLLNHLRIEDGKEPIRPWSARAEELIRDIGVVPTVSRLGGMPVDLTNTYVSALESMPAGERLRSMRVIRRMLLGSPVGVVHLARLWQALYPSSRQALTFRKRLAKLFLREESRNYFDAWLSVLRWVDEQFGFQQTARQLATDVRLALVWTHADRVYRILLARGLDAEWIREAFADTEHPIGHDFVFPDSRYAIDLAAPRHISVESFPLAALAAIGIDDDVVSEMAADVNSVFDRIADDRRWRVVRAMMADEEGATNLLGSWLAAQRKWLPLVPSAFHEELTHEAVTETVRNACEGILAKDDERKHWSSLRAAVGSHPPSSKTLAVLETLMTQVDVADYLSRDVLLAAVAVNLMSSLSRYFRTTAREHLQMQLLALAAQISKTKLTDDERDALSDSVLDALLSCAWSQETDGRAATFAAALLELEERAPDVFGKNPWFVLRLCEMLPPHAARHFWRVRELMRRRTRL